MSVLPGYHQVHGATPRTTAYRVTSAPWRIVLHTVEGDPRDEAAMAAVARVHGNGPHLWVSPRLAVKIQTVPIDRAARALARPRGAGETNHMRAVQVEIFGRAAETHTWPREWNEWLGREVVAPIVREIRALGGDVDLGVVEQTYGAGAGIVLAVASSPIRHTPDQWARCNHVTTHQRVPWNSHWDCGGLDLATVLTSARTALGEQPATPPATSPGDDDLMAAVDHINRHTNVVGDAIKNEITRLGLSTASFIAANQKTAVLYRIAGQTAPWWGLVGGTVVGPLTFDDALEFKRHHEITENSAEIPQRWHDIYTRAGAVTVSDESVEAIAAAVSPVDAELINGLADATAQRIAQQVLAQLGDEISSQVLTDIAAALSEAAERVGG